ncbi:MAG: hypothetical protein OJF49_002147 [Ktedonobacterales bacterium]|nr:MAG: hypothetical protein OJF49_002147 [Ktedonobacterales bacterium]
MTVEEIEAYVAPNYAAKDEMHNLAHIRRVYALAEEIGGHHPHDTELLMLGAYLHGIIYDEGREDDIRRFLQNAHLTPERIEQAIQIAWESQKEGVPDMIEGRLLHDAHLLEGGKTFIIVKSLVTGTARGQTLAATIRYIEERVLGQFACSLPEAQRLYAEKERCAREFLADLKRHL